MNCDRTEERCGLSVSCPSVKITWLSERCVLNTASWTRLRNRSHVLWFAFLEIGLGDRSDLSQCVPHCWNQSVQHQHVKSVFLLTAEQFEVGGERCEQSQK